MIEITEFSTGRVLHLVDADSLADAHLEGLNLVGADLTAADLSRANLRRANLEGAHLTMARLSEANLSHAELSGADLSLADLTGARLLCTRAERACFRGATFVRANLSAAHLTSADLSSADLSRAMLLGTNFQDAQLRSVKLRGGLYGPNTVWPHGFDPERRGGTLIVPPPTNRQSGKNRCRIERVSLDEAAIRHAGSVARDATDGRRHRPDDLSELQGIHGPELIYRVLLGFP